MAKYYNMNLTADYLPQWGVWEVVREVVCNAMDADPDGMTLLNEGEDTVVVATQTVPELSQVLVVGAGTKRAGGSTIGQFGEGLKMAALVATRLGKGGLVLETADMRIVFGFRKVLGIESLHAQVTMGDTGVTGFKATICLPGAVPAYEGKILVRQPWGPMPKRNEGSMRVYVKGVFIANLATSDSLYDWNLPKVETNRNRNMVSEWNAQYAMGQWFANNITTDHVGAMLENSKSPEAKSMEYHSDGNRVQTAFVNAFAKLHGEKAVLAMGGESDHAVERKGYTLVTIEYPELRKALAKVVNTARKVHKSNYNMEAVDTSQYASEIADLRRLDKLVKAPNLTLRVFAQRNNNLMGLADLNEHVLWLSEELFVPGQERERVRTYLHEVAHHISRANDGSVAFENALDGMLGTVGLMAMNHGFVPAPVADYGVEIDLGDDMLARMLGTMFRKDVATGKRYMLELTEVPK